MDWTGTALAERRPTPALSHGEEQRSYAELAERADRVAGGLRAAGLRPGDRVLALLPSGIETYELLLGCARAGLVLVPLNWRLSAPELATVAADAAPRASFVHPAYADRLPSGPGLRVDMDGYPDWLAAYEPDKRTEAAPEDVVLQVYTSGTSGRPKGVLLTHGNLTAKVPRAAAEWGLGPESVVLLSTPLFHVAGLGWGLVGLYSGARTVVTGPADPRELARLLRQERVTHSFLVPTILQALAEQDGGYPDLDTVVFGAAPITGPALTRVRTALACRLIHVYGLTETTGAITQQVVDEAAGTSAGRPYPWVELSVRNPDTGRPVGTLTAGEVWTRSAQNTIGYAGNAAASRALLSADGWLRTGDVGVLDATGALTLTDRLTDLIVTGGENVYPAEVEAVLRQHPDVADVAVLGLPDDHWGEVVTAAVVPIPGHDPDPEVLLAFCHGRLAGYKRPRAVQVVAALPRTATGKVRRQDVAAALP